LSSSVTAANAIAGSNVRGGKLAQVSLIVIRGSQADLAALGDGSLEPAATIAGGDH